MLVSCRKKSIGGQQEERQVRRYLESAARNSCCVSVILGVCDVAQVI